MLQRAGLQLAKPVSLLSGAGTPRFELTLSNGQPVLVETGGPGGSARPALAGAALAEAAEQAGGRIAGWVTGLVRSGGHLRLGYSMDVLSNALERAQWV